MTIQERITGVILAGGQATRMGGVDKGLVDVAGVPMVAHIIQSLRPQIHDLIINANRNLDRYGALDGCRVVSDVAEGFQGPLAGMASAMQNTDEALIVTVPCDSPLIAGDLVVRLHQALIRDNAHIAVASDGERLQPVFALIRCTLLESLKNYMASGQRKIDRWYQQHIVSTVEFGDRKEMFLNINTPEDRDQLELTMIGSRTC